MYKRLEFYPEDKNGVEMELIHPGVLTKTAEMSSDLNHFIKNMEIKDSKVYVLVNALSAGEWYGPNRNGDYIAEPVLQKYHKHFEDQGHVYKHHKNKDPQTALGRILHSSYNPNMHRVELVCELDGNKDERFINRIQEGEYPAVSMGMRTPYDQCSICGHKAKRLPEYCNHLKYEMNRVYPDGRKTYAINPAAKFFDISFVIIPADATAGVMKKLASTVSARPSAELGEEFLREAALKEADLYKEVEIPAEVQSITKDPNGNILLSQPFIPKSELKAMVKDASLGEACSTLMGMRIMPTPVDFQRMALYSQGQEKLAEALDKEGICLIDINEDTKPIYPDDVSLANFNDKLAVKYAHLMRDRSLTKPLVTARILEKVAMTETRFEQEAKIPAYIRSTQDKEDHEFYLRKEPSQVRKVFLGVEEDPKMLPYKNPVMATAALSGLFYGLQKVNNEIGGVAATGKFDAFLLRRPWLIPLLVGAGTVTALQVQENFHKTAAMIDPNVISRYLVAVPASYIYAGQQESKVRKGEQIGKIQNLIRKHPFLASMVGGWGLGKVQQSLLKVSSKNENIQKVLSTLSPDKLDELFNDVTHI